MVLRTKQKKHFIVFIAKIQSNEKQDNYTRV